MTLPLAFRLVIVRCPGCMRRNSVDLARARPSGWPTCGSCKTILPKRLPTPLLATLALVLPLLLVGVVLLGKGLSGVWEDRQLERALSEAREQLALGRHAEALALLPPPPRSGASLAVAKELATELAEGVLSRPLAQGLPLVELREAAREGDELMAQYAEELPELVPLLDETVRSLQARRDAELLLEEARALLESAPGDLSAMEGALTEARRQSRDHALRTREFFEQSVMNLMDQSYLAAARVLASSGPAGSRQASALIRLQSSAASPPSFAPVSSRSMHRSAQPADRVSGPAGSDPAAHFNWLARALRDRDRAALLLGVSLRPGKEWSGEQTARFSDLLRMACEALGSLAAEEAREASGPGERAALLLQASTCDEVLAASFILALRRQLAEQYLDDARSGGDLRLALSAHAGLSGYGRNAALGEIAILAERAGSLTWALKALSLLPADSVGAVLRGEELEISHAPSWPTLDYPSLPEALVASGARED